MARHATRILDYIENGKTVYSSVCSCGYVSVKAADITKARQDGNAHVVQAMRGVFKDPAQLEIPKT